MKKLGVVNQTVEQPVREPLRNPDQTPEVQRPDLRFVQAQSC
jgi:hypothetical protein